MGGAAEFVDPSAEHLTTLQLHGDQGPTRRHLVGHFPRRDSSHETAQGRAANRRVGEAGQADFSISDSSRERILHTELALGPGPRHMRNEWCQGATTRFNLDAL